MVEYLDLIFLLVFLPLPLALLALRRKENYKPVFKIPFAEILTPLGLVLIAWVIQEPLKIFFALAVLLSALLIYELNKSKGFSENILKGIASIMIAIVIPVLVVYFL